MIKANAKPEQTDTVVQPIRQTQDRSILLEVGKVYDGGPWSDWRRLLMSTVESVLFYIAEVREDAQKGGIQDAPSLQHQAALRVA